MVSPKFPLVLLLAVALCGCSPVYVTKAAAGHASLLWHSRSMAAALRDPATPEDLKAGLKLALEVREFAFQRMGLKPSRDFSTYTPVHGAVTYVVSACPRTSLEAYQWWFPFVGKVPYKGYFRKDDALREMKSFEDNGFDARVGGVAAYKTPLWFTDPLPSNVLDYPPGDLAELLIHELTHGTVWFKDRVDFDEAAATFVGQEGAADFLTLRFGADSAQLREYRAGLARGREFAVAMDELYQRLGALYRGPATDQEKLARREEIFAWGRKRLEEMGQPLSEPLNNAAVLAHRLYNYDLSGFRALHERCGRDWKKTVAALKALDRSDPLGALTKLTSAEPR
ncbi:MAG: aminopeptidase [Elusimicrobia bacterium]|nr:aminopeptidase [Elusimicrobiota bacterium]